VREGTDAGQRFDLEEDTEIGRDTDRCQIVLNDDWVSGAHARVKCETGHFFIYDEGSRNGTFVNERKVQRQLLRDGMEVRIGNTVMVFKQASRGR
jgi:pSer/pThr/pTyr-binding forkhead associated (FHA) protein